MYLDPVFDQTSADKEFQFEVSCICHGKWPVILLHASVQGYRRWLRTRRGN